MSHSNRLNRLILGGIQSCSNRAKRAIYTALQQTMAAPVDKAHDMFGGQHPQAQPQQPPPASSGPRILADPRLQNNFNHHHGPTGINQNQNALPAGDKPQQQPQQYPQATPPTSSQNSQRTGDMNPMGTFAISSAADLKKALGDTLSSATTREQQYPTPQEPHKQNGIGAESADPPHQRPQRGDSADRGGYERHIGRGISWRREHNEGDSYSYPRGRGRGGPPPPGRGRGGAYHRDSSRSSSGDYPYRRDYEHRPAPPRGASPPHPASTRPYPAPDIYFESGGAYTASPPRYESSGRYPADAGYYDDYRRAYDPRGPPPPSAPPAHSPSAHLDSRRSYDAYDRRSEYERTYPRSRDARDDYPPPVADPRYPPDFDPRYREEGTTTLQTFSNIFSRPQTDV